MAPALYKELDTYDRNKDQLVGQAEGKYVLIHDGEIAGIWETYEDALQAGYTQFGLEPFLVKQIQSIERVCYFSRDIEACPSSHTQSD